MKLFEKLLEYKLSDFYIGKNVELNGNFELIGCDEYLITSDEKILSTTELHTCVAMLVIGEKVGLAHLNLNGYFLSPEQLNYVNKLLTIENIEEIDFFLGPKTDVENFFQIFGKIKNKNVYFSYINNPLSFELYTGNIVYDTATKKLYGKNDYGYVEYRKGYLNAMKSDEKIYDDYDEMAIDRQK